MCTDLLSTVQTPSWLQSSQHMHLRMHVVWLIALAEERLDYILPMWCMKKILGNMQTDHLKTPLWVVRYWKHVIISVQWIHTWLHIGYWADLFFWDRQCRLHRKAPWPQSSELMQNLKSLGSQRGYNNVHITTNCSLCSINCHSWNFKWSKAVKRIQTRETK